MANSSKIFILILLVTGLVCGLILLPANSAQAWEVVTGRISSMQAVGEKVRLTVLLDTQTAATDIATEEQQAKTGKTTLKSDQSNSATNSINLEVESRNLPPRLKKGDYIRIWSKPGSLQKPWRISTSRGHDPTGVRSRLHGRGRHSGGNSGRSGGKGGHGGH